MGLLDRLLGTDSAESRERAAEARWTENNRRAREAGCHCGRPATEVRYDHRNVGRVPVEFWSCSEHVGVEMWSGSTPGWKHSQPCPLGEEMGRGGPIDQPATHCYCPHREH